MTPHKHAALIKAWADGIEIQVNDGAYGWIELSNQNAWFNAGREYRIKPNPVAALMQKIIRYGDMAEDVPEYAEALFKEIEQEITILVKNR